MRIQLNGKDHQVKAARNVQTLIKELSLVDKRIAVELNHSVLPRSQYESTFLSEGDKIEIIHAIGGG